MSDMAERLRRVARDESSEWSTWQDLCNDSAAEIERLRGRIEEIKASIHHSITTEQIDAAWGWRGEFVARYCPSLFDDVMKEFGIVRCEECGGSQTYTEGNDDGSKIRIRDCPACNGHGWRKK